MRKKALISASLAAGLLLGAAAYPAVEQIEVSQGITASAATGTTTDGWKFSYDDTHCEITGCTDAVRGAVTVPASIEIDGKALPVTKITSAFNESAAAQQSITSLTVPASVTTIANSAFWKMKSLETADIQAQITAAPSSMFSNCTSLVKVKLPDGLLTIGINAFYDCLRLKDIRLPDTVKTIGDSAFKGCESLETINIPGSVTILPESLFYGCSALKTVSIGEGVMTMSSYVFQNCIALEEVTFPKSMTKVSSPLMFSGCKSLKSLTFENPETAIEYISGTEEKPVTFYGYEGSTAEQYVKANGGRSYLVFKSIGEKPAPEPVQDYGVFCDANGDGTVDIIDVQLILKYYVEDFAGNKPSWYEITGNPKAPDAP